MFPSDREAQEQTQKKTSIRVQAKALVPIAKVGSVITSSTNHKMSFNKILEKAIGTPSLLFNCMPAAGLWSYVYLGLALIWLVVAVE